jgi:hypothetical protein
MSSQNLSVTGRTDRNVAMCEGGIFVCGKLSYLVVYKTDLTSWDHLRGTGRADFLILNYAPVPTKSKIFFALIFVECDNDLERIARGHAPGLKVRGLSWLAVSPSELL